MGQSKLDPFDIVLVEGGDEKLNNAYPKAYPARGPKLDLIAKAFADLQKNGGGIDGDLSMKHCFTSPAFLAKRPRSNALRLCIAYLAS